MWLVKYENNSFVWSKLEVNGLIEKAQFAATKCGDKIIIVDGYQYADNKVKKLYSIGEIILLNMIIENLEVHVSLLKH